MGFGALAIFIGASASMGQEAPKAQAGTEVVDAQDWKASALRPGDVLSVSVFRVPEFSKQVRIDEDGTFIYPLCGEIKAAGRTVRVIAKELEQVFSVSVLCCCLIRVVNDSVRICYDNVALIIRNSHSNNVCHRARSDITGSHTVSACRLGGWRNELGSPYPK